MIASRTFESPAASAAFFEKALEQDLCAHDGFLQYLYEEPARWFQGEAKVLTYEREGVSVGILVVAEGNFVLSDLRDRYGASHYGYIQVFVQKRHRREGIATSLLRQLYRENPEKRFVVGTKLRFYKDHSDRTIRLMPADLHLGYLNERAFIVNNGRLEYQ